MIAWQKPLKVGKVDRYSVDLTNWLDGQAVTGATLTPTLGLVTAGTTTIDGNVVSWLLTGVGVGVELFDLEYTTSSRSDCEEIQLKVEAC